MTILILTGSQTVGPFFDDALLRPGAHCPVLITPTAEGVRIRITGRVIDGDGVGVPDAMLEIWQANQYGRYNHPADQRDLPLDPTFSGFGRTGTDETGAYWFETIKPGPVPLDGTRLQAPHICVAVFARGLLNHLFTRLYFGDEAANAADRVLLSVPAERRATLVAQPVEDNGRLVYHFDIVLQGAGETVFFNV